MANVEVTFNEPVGESEVSGSLSKAIQDGRLGQFKVLKVTVGTTSTISGEQNWSIIFLHSPDPLPLV